MNLDELQSIQSRERQASSLQNLRPSFYQDVGEFIQELTRERDRAAERADDPFSSPEVRRLSDDIETAKSTVEAIYERRVGKVVKMASIAAAGMPTDENGLTDEERELFSTLVERIEQSREHVLNGVLEGDGSGISCSREPVTEPSESEPTPNPTDTPASDDPAPEPSAAAELGLVPTPDTDDAPPAPPDTPADARASGEVSAADMMGDGDDTGSEAAAGDRTPATRTTADAAGADDTAAADESGESPSVDRTTVRITRDVGEVFGVDERSYDLSAEDIVDLPAENVEPLLKQDAAEPLE